MQGTAVMGCISQGAGETDRAPAVGPLKAQRGRREQGATGGCRAWVCCHPRWTGAGRGLPSGPREGEGMQTAGCGGAAGRGRGRSIFLVSLLPAALGSRHVTWPPVEAGP